jgi:beta-glucanase (GH16 family)
MRYFIQIVFTVGIIIAIGCTEKKEIPVVTPPTPIVDKNWQFETTPVWADEFNTGNQPDASRWSYDVGGGGWGNNELQFYTNGANTAITGGNLVITARRENMGSNQYTSARLVSRGKGDWLYGKFEIRAKVPKGRGTWPALWMLPTDNHYGQWPASGEIDIMEHVGHDPERIHFSIHTNAFNHMINTQRSSSRMLPGATDEFNVYSCEWTPFSIRGFINGVRYFEFTNANTGFAAWPFDRRFHFIFNIAVGGNWGGQQGVDVNAFPTSMLVDYVRVYRMIPQ